MQQRPQNTQIDPAQTRGPQKNPQQAGQMTLQQAVHQVLTLYSARNYAPAAELIARLCAARPKDGYLRHLAGLVAAGQGNADKAREDLNAAVAMTADNPMVLSNATEALRQVEALEDAIAAGEAAIKIGPNIPVTWCNLGLAYYDNKDLEKAEECQKKAIDLDPAHANALNNLGSIARDNMNHEDAMEFYKRAADFDRNPVQPLSNLAVVAVECGKVDEAKTALSRLFSVDPNHPVGQATQARVFLMDGDLDSAERAAKRAIAGDAEKLDGPLVLAQVMLEKNRSNIAIQIATKAHEKEPDNIRVLQLLGACHSDLGDVSQAKVYYEQALEIEPKFMQVRLALGHLEMEMGNLDRARELFEAALEERPEDQGPLSAMAQIEKITDPDSAIYQGLKKLEPENEKLPPARQAGLLYALGKTSEDLKLYKDAFGYYQRGAAAKRTTLQFDGDAYDRMMTQLMADTSAERLQSIRAQSAVEGDRPIFVLGMPRSGTTLTETILSRHPQVQAAGELDDWARTFAFRTQLPQIGFPKPLPTITADEMRRAGQIYLKRLEHLSDGAPRVTDKMPMNYALLGLIWAIMPGAKIIHVSRNPMDVCLSNYTRLFQRSQPHSYDLQELGRVYITYTKLMAHWRKVLPEGAFMTLPYDELVEDNEGWTRKMLAHCDLEWDDACLNSHEADRRVRTASVLQVREKIYTSSKEKWRRYEEQLEPLRAQLAEAGVI